MKKWDETIIRNELIIYVFDYMKDKTNNRAKDAAIEHLKTLSANYKAVLKRRRIPNLENAWREFVLNKKGFLVTIPDLYNALLT